MNKFVHKTIAAVMIAGASTGVASTALMTTAHAANLADSTCLLYTSPSPRDGLLSRMPSSA